MNARAMAWSLGARCLAAALLLGACSKDSQRVELSDPGDDADAPPQCQLEVRDVGLDEATPIGASANDLFHWIAGSHSEPLLWLDRSAYGDRYAHLDGFGPEQGTSMLQLDFEPLGAHVLTRSPLDPASGDICPTSLALDVNLHLSTASGALDETVQTTLEATQSSYAKLQPLYVPIDSLRGSFTAQISLEPGFDYTESPKLWLSLTLSEAGAVGNLVLVTLVSNGRGEVGSIPTIARFPNDGDLCQDGMYLVATDRSVEGVSRDAVLQQLNGASPALIDDGPATMELEYAGIGERACVQPGSGAIPTTLWFPATVRLHSSDGRVDGSIQTSLWGEASSGALHSRADALSELNDTAAAAATAPSYALREPIDFTGFDGGNFEFQADVTPGSASGSLIVSGVIAPQCSGVTAESASYGTRCTPELTSELWAARWSKR